MLFRLDIVGLHTEAKPTVGVQDGTTLYWVDTRQFFIYYKGTWYEQTESQEEPAEETSADDTREEPAEETLADDTREEPAEETLADDTREEPAEETPADDTREENNER